MDTRPHIVHIIHSLRPGGAQKVALDLSTYPTLADKYRFSAVCILNDNKGKLEQTHLRYEIETYSCPLVWPFNSIPIPSYRINRWLRSSLLTATFDWRVERLLARIKADLVHFHGLGTVFPLLATAVSKMSLPLIWTLHGEQPNSLPRKLSWAEVINAINRSESIYVAAVSHSSLASLKRKGPLSEKKGRVIYNGIDSGFFASPHICGSDLRSKWGIPSDALVFGTAGRLANEKRHDIFIEAAARLIASGESAHFVIAGEGSERNKLAKYIRELSCEKQIHLVGSQQTMQCFLSELDVFVMCSDSEGFGLALLEACAMGLACISTMAGGPQEILSEDGGILVKPGSVRELTSALRRMTYQSTRDKYRRNATRAAERFPFERTAQQYDMLYSHALNFRNQSLLKD